MGCMEIELENFRRKQLLKLLAIILISEGYLNTNSKKNSPYIKLETLSSSQSQHLLFENICMNLFNTKPKKYTFKRFNALTGNYHELSASQLTVSKHIKEICSLLKTETSAEFIFFSEITSIDKNFPIRYK